MQAGEVIHFWRDAGPEHWFNKSEVFDDMCEIGFADACVQAAQGELDDWMESADGALALMILLDQLPRNIYRGTPQVYAADARARELANQAIVRGLDQEIDTLMRQFFYTPFMHSEDLGDQDRSVQLYESMGDDTTTKWARHHRDIIRRFGRFPHRNAILGRETTAEEQAWLDQGGFKG